MDAVTYPADEVADFIEQNVIALRIPVDNKELMTKFNVKWTPTLVILDPVHRKEPLARLSFPRQPDERHLCLADFFRREPGSDVVAFQVVTVGHEASRVAEAWQEKGDYSRALFLHGLAVETAEALAEYWHRVVRRELGLPAEQGKRYSPGYPSWPELVDQRQIWRLLDPVRAIGVSLTSADQMVPEQSTSAIVLHHPDAVYYTVRGR